LCHGSSVSFTHAFHSFFFSFSYFALHFIYSFCSLSFYFFALLISFFSLLLFTFFLFIQSYFHNLFFPCAPLSPPFRESECYSIGALQIAAEHRPFLSPHFPSLPLPFPCYIVSVAAVGGGEMNVNGTECIPNTRQMSTTPSLRCRQIYVCGLLCNEITPKDSHILAYIRCKIEVQSIVIDPFSDIEVFTPLVEW
jgi:hypothetical protein